MALNIEHLRQEYALMELNREDLKTNPFQQFESWFEEASSAQVSEPNAMVLSTIDLEGYPAGRVVLLKGFDQDGFVFYTNYESGKGQEIARNQKVSLTFLWKEIHRQVRIQESPLRPVMHNPSAIFKAVRERVKLAPGPHLKVRSSNPDRSCSTILPNWKPDFKKRRCYRNRIFGEVIWSLPNCSNFGRVDRADCTTDSAIS